jgi:hypothetical protein
MAIGLVIIVTLNLNDRFRTDLRGGWIEESHFPRLP